MQTRSTQRSIVMLILLGLLVLGFDWAANPEPKPARFTFGVGFKLPKLHWNQGSPRVFVRYIDTEQHNFFARTLRFALQKPRSFYATEFLTGYLADSKGISAITVAVSGTTPNSCRQLVGRKPNGEDDYLMLDGAARSPTLAELNTVIRYVSDAEPQPKGVVELPGPSSLKLFDVKLIGGGFTIQCDIREIPQRITYSSYQMQFDSIFRSGYDGPAETKISPPWDSTNWTSTGDSPLSTLSFAPDAMVKRQCELSDKNDAILSILNDPTQCKGSIEAHRDLTVALQGPGKRRDFFRSDFPSALGALSVVSPTMRVQWTYPDDDQAREFVMLIAASIGGFMVGLLVDLFHQLSLPKAPNLTDLLARLWSSVTSRNTQTQPSAPERPDDP